MVKFTANQLLIISNFEDFHSSTMLKDITIALSHHYQSFFIIIEVDLADKWFIIGDDAFNTGDLFGWIKGVIVIVSEFFHASKFYQLKLAIYQARLAIV